MIGTKLAVFLIVGTLIMFIQMILRGKYNSIAVVKYPFIAVFLTMAGTSGALIMFWIENGYIGGRSFFGAILFVPVLMLPICWVLKIPFGELLDLCSAAECAMLALLKIECITSGCCYGRVLSKSESGEIVRFPSQFVELVVVLFIMFYLMRIEKEKENHNLLYPMYMILYGGTRFMLNWLRGDLEPFVWGLPAGSFWGICSVIIGLSAYILIKGLQKEKS